jgi:hypothetical protein
MIVERRETELIDQLLQRAQQRVFLQSLTEVACIATAVFAVFCALVFVIGTALLALWVPVAAALLALGVALFRAFQARPSALRAALTLDRRCHLSDALSTELHFRGSNLETARAQRSQAEAAARTVVVEHALPFSRPRWLYPAAGFVSFALFLFILRFGIQQRLDLTPPLVAIHQDPLSMAARQDEAAKTKKNADPDVMSRLGASTPDDPTEQNLPNPPGTAVDAANPASPNSQPANVASGKTTDGEQNEPGSPDQQSAAGDQKPGADQSPSSRDGAPQSAQGGSKGQGSPESSGLLSKLRDAMAGLMSKMKPQGGQTPPGGQQNSQQANGKQPSANQQSGQKGGQDGQKSADGQPQAGEDDQAAADSEQGKSGDGKGKTDQNAAAKPGSGMGHSDGSKELKDAEQLEAMGKLSEIIGKRSASITGEMTIESQSGPQQLKTTYAHNNAKHAATSGDVARDEIPVELQAYVQKYFEQVRKKAPKRSATP